MKTAENESLVETLSRCGLHVQVDLCEKMDILGNIFRGVASVVGIPRKGFQELHSRYDPVPEVYVRQEVFDSFCPPRRYLNQLRDELAEDVDLDIFLEALGCYFEPNEQEHADLNSKLTIPVAPPKSEERSGLVLMCWDRIAAAAPKLGVEAVFLLLYVVAFHEHSHAARAAKLLKRGSADVLQAEETVAQWETYMFLRSRQEEKAIEAMKKLMDEQPNCYRIPIP